MGVPMRKEKVAERVKNFKEVDLGYSEGEAMMEADRCLQCKIPGCIKSCPVKNRIPEFILAIREKRFSDAKAILKDTNFCPEITGRVCLHFCQNTCVLNSKNDPIQIKNLERFAADYGELPYLSPERRGMTSVAIIGTGPAGLSCAAELAKAGLLVTIFDENKKIGGVLANGIPEFRLPDKILRVCIDELRVMGVDFKRKQVGEDPAIEDLRNDFDFIVLAYGACSIHELGILGEEKEGIYSAIDFLKRVANKEKVKLGKKVVIVGGGYVALDAARTARRLGAETTIVYRRTEAEMNASRHEIADAKEEGIKFEFLLSPVEILGTNKIYKVKFQKNEIRKDNATPKGKIIPLDEFVEIGADVLIKATGQSVNSDAFKKQVDVDEKYCTVLTNARRETNLENVYASGDCVSGPTSVSEAIASGKETAEFIKNKLAYMQ